MMAAKKTWLYMPDVTPMSRTRPARSAKPASSSAGRPKSLVRRAPATLKRSLMVAVMAALRL